MGLSLKMAVPRSCHTDQAATVKTGTPGLGFDLGQSQRAAADPPLQGGGVRGSPPSPLPPDPRMR